MPFFVAYGKLTENFLSVRYKRALFLWGYKRSFSADFLQNYGTITVKT